MNTCWEWQCCCHQEFHFLPVRTEDLASPAQRGRGRVSEVTWRWPLPTSSPTAASLVIKTLVLTIITICGPVCIKWSWQATLHYWLLTPQSMWTKELLNKTLTLLPATRQQGTNERGQENPRFTFHFQNHRYLNVHKLYHRRYLAKTLGMSMYII